MIEITDKNFVYLTRDERDAIKKLKRHSKPSGTYYKKIDKLVRIIGYSWLIPSLTIARLKICHK